MKGSRLLLVALLALGVGLGLLIAGAPWQTPNEPVKVVSLDSTTTTARPATTTTTEVRVTTTTAEVRVTTTTADDESTTSTEDTGTAGKRGPTTTTAAGPLE